MTGFNLNDWFEANKLSLNGSKSCYLLFSNSKLNMRNVLKIGDEPLKRETVTKFLGVFIDERLSWVDHINYVKRKMLSGMFAINAGKLFVPARILRMLYYTLVYPHILYGITLWSAAYEIHLSKINVLHKKIIRSMCNVNYNDHTNELFVQLGILKLQDIVRRYPSDIVYKLELKLATG